jgi:hypothetical protein
MKSIIILAACGAATLFSSAADAQVVARISPVDRFAWGENVGWMDFASADNVPDAVGVRVQTGFLTGWIWAENIGWIRVGNPSGGPYDNTTGDDYGVNVNITTGALSGYAWSENTGWINFSGGALASPAQPARIDFDARRFQGFAWSPNIGWINLGNSTTFVGLGCPADLTGEGDVDFGDFLAFFNCYDQGDVCAEIDGSSGIDFGDFLAFFNSYDAGC